MGGAASLHHPLSRPRTRTQPSVQPVVRCSALAASLLCEGQHELMGTQTKADTPASANTITLLDSEEIERFFVETTGMRPGYLQLSRGAANLKIRSVDLAGVTLIWSRAQTKARWRDEMTGGKLHIGFAVESDGSITSRGRAIGKDAAQVWMPGKEMDLIMGGPNLTLEIAVEPDLVEALGWTVSGDPLRRVRLPVVERLVRACQRASEAILLLRDEQESALSTRRNAVLWRDEILELLEPVIQPWLSPPGGDALSVITATTHYQLVQRGDDFMARLGLCDTFQVDELSQTLGVPRRSLFYAYRKVLGIGPRQYFELRRLHQLRQLLRQAESGETSVTSLAIELGFTDMGRMAASYRRQFGENPSYTLKCVR